MDSQSLDTIAALNAANEQMEIDDEDDTKTQGQAQSETQHVQATETVSHSKRAKSLVWNHFVIVGVEADGKRRSRCIHCNKKLVSKHLLLVFWKIYERVLSLSKHLDQG